MTSLVSTLSSKDFMLTERIRRENERRKNSQREDGLLNGSVDVFVAILMVNSQ